MPIYPGMPSFPGDPPVRSTQTQSLENGDAYNLSSWTIGSHTGTHIDPPRHFFRGGASIEDVDPTVLNGPCRVLSVGNGVQRVGPAELERVPEGTQRLLLRTGNSTRWLSEPGFFADYASLTLEGARLVVAKGVRLVGIDALSIESGVAGAFPVHQALLGSGTIILEGLMLADVEEGNYRLHCLPLRLREGDGGPARAMLSPW